MTTIPFNRPYMTGKELDYISAAYSNAQLAGDGPFTARCHAYLEEATGSGKVLLTHSCTAALEMCAMLLDVQAGDEIIMPSYTFVSTANAFVLRGGVPVFVDIRCDTLNIDETLIEAAITPRTRAIVVVHYAGVACDMDTIMRIARARGLVVIEDAAQGYMSYYKGRMLGSIGALGTYSFHETKNVMCGEGGALLVNNAGFRERAEIIREKGTDRSRFFRGEVDKYTWQLCGSSYLPGELTAAFLWAQLEASQSITAHRLRLWDHYHRALAPLAEEGLLTQPVIPPDCTHNGHMYYVLLRPGMDRNTVLEALREEGIRAIFHYVPLHASPAGQCFGRTHGVLDVTSDVAQRIIRLPLWIGLETQSIDKIATTLHRILVN